ncbi:GNAT family N-acetyltransferase [Actinomycetospora sp. TBRC 11914]|uniref:GNAT family N-acetyltransferase n=1 Tax=Actinomycetospora sp. TBRC 11914 TaxID=2729387 RepID=UPI00145CA627|nr:GNAT family N-acetyltransferase [Actinomycetospora sp. TBRC 11914]NMO89738.1 GNAT family N-acetyltransferase [Actinomycetospora sp. TBRC 11914]
MAPELTDGVIVLSALALEDAPALVAGEDDELARRLVGGHSTVATSERYIEACAADWRRRGPTLSWAIRDAAGGALAGTVEVGLRVPELEPGAANVSYGVFPSWRGRGFAARAVELVCGFLAAETGVSYAVLRIERDNPASLRVAERSGFRASQHLAPARASMRWFSRELRGG